MPSRAQLVTDVALSSMFCSIMYFFIIYLLFSHVRTVLKAADSTELAGRGICVFPTVYDHTQKTNLTVSLKIKQNTLGLDSMSVCLSGIAIVTLCHRAALFINVT